MKKIIYIITCLSLIIIMTGCNSNKKNQTIKVDGENVTVGTSNKKDNNKFQVKVIHETINIRKEATTKSDKLGVVKKDSYFDVIDYTSDTNYAWFHIKTDNNIEGYIASLIEQPYVELINEVDFDITPPELKLLTNTIAVDYHTNINESLIKQYIEYSDKNDSNPKISFNVDYDKKVDNRTYQLIIIVTDKNNNSVSKKAKIEITNEKQTTKGEWLSYDKVQEMRKIYERTCNKYGGYLLNDYADCQGEKGTTRWRRQSDLSLVIQPEMAIFGEEGSACIYEDRVDLSKAYCYKDKDHVNRNMIADYMSKYEQEIFNHVAKYEQECIDLTGYTVEDLRW